MKKIAEFINRTPNVRRYQKSSGIALIAGGLAFGVAPNVLAQDTEILLEEVVVTGVRGSLQKSLGLKRDAIGVVDGIIAEDIGKFPDLNIGDALQRIPGVTLERDFASNGEGRRINVRGLPSDFIQTTVNGITAASSSTNGSDATRSFDFDIFASELFSAVTVAKTASADIADGGLTATVNLQTPRAFDYDEQKFVASISGQKADLQGSGGGIDPRVALLFSDKYNNDTVGVTLSLAHSDTTVRGDWTQGFRFGDTGGAFLNNTLNGADRVAGTADDLSQSDIDSIGTTVNGSAASLAQLRDVAANTLAPLLPRVGPNISDRDTLGISAGLQIQATDRLLLSADLLFATFDETQYRGTIDGLTGFGRQGVVPRSLTVSNGALVGATLGNITQRTESVEDAFENEFAHLTFSADYEINDDWIGFAQIGFSEAETSELRRTYLFQHTGEFVYDLSDATSPQFSGSDFDYLNPNDYEPGGFRFRPREREDEQQSFQVDFERIFDNDGPLTSVKFGTRYADKEVSQQRGERRDFDTSGLDFNNFAQSAQSIAPGFLSGFAPGTPSNFLLTNPEAGDAFLPRSLTSTVPNDPQSSWTVEETSTAAYVKSEWDFGKLRAELGARLVQTDQTSSGSQVVGGQATPISIDNDYTNFLPSLNLKYDAGESLVLRFAANTSISRPTLGQLSPGISVQPTTLNASAGNPRLDPFEANQFDLSVEWYFAEESLLSATLFYKDIESFITSGQTSEVINGTNLVNDDGESVSGSTFTVSRPVNGEGGKLSGIELSYQQPFGDTGFGVLANSTISDSEGNIFGSRRELVGHSDLSYNLIGYYEKDALSVRLAYSFRSDYLETVRGGVDQRLDDRNQLDLSIGYDWNDNLSLSFDALNVTGEDFYSFHGNPSLNRLYIDQEPVYLFGIRYNH
ncbi:MAG: iron complex outermembrane receptor protein [Arenicella sp.]|jgi:iron complex outermembrane receptor protein